MNLQPVLRRQVFGRQRRPKALAYRSAVLFPHLPQHLLSKLLVVGAIRASPRVAMLQPRSSFLPIPLPQPLGLPVAHPQQSTGIHDPQLLAAHSSQHFHSSQLPLAHLRSPQSDLLSEVLLRGHFYRGQKGTLSPRDNRALIQYWFPAFFCSDMLAAIFTRLSSPIVDAGIADCDSPRRKFCEQLRYGR